MGFVIDHSRCIGCHACTVACKSENDVPVGNFRTWVKYTESGEFPSVRRSFAVLRCNQCTAAPCITICPVKALSKRPDGIVDVDPDRCIGCKSCMQACPYDALYLNEERGTVQKCHFCAHRTERGLAPACAVVCPTEAIIPGDFHDPESRVSQMKRSGELQARKLEAGTGPNVWYREIATPGIDPLATNGAGGWLWANQVPGAQLTTELWEAMEAKAHGEQAKARTVYNVQHKPMWGARVSTYLFTKSLAAGGFLAPLALVSSRAAFDGAPAAAWHFAWGGALVFLALTAVLLVLDLKRPERFWYLLRYAQWDSWLTRGGVILGLYGLLLGICFLLGIRGGIPDRVPGALLIGTTTLLAALTAAYTAWLFGQAKGRVLWLRRLLAPHLLAQALVAGCAFLLLSTPILPWSEPAAQTMRYALLAALVVHGALTLLEERLAPRGREVEYARVVRLVTHGPFARRHWFLGVGLGITLPILALLLLSTPPVDVLVALAVLFGLFTEEDILVRAGQAVPIS